MQKFGFILSYKIYLNWLQSIRNHSWYTFEDIEKGLSTYFLVLLSQVVLISLTKPILSSISLKKSGC